MDLQPVDIVAVIGCVLAVLSLLWQCKTWRDSHRERALVRFRWEPGDDASSFSAPAPPAVIAEVVNVGRVPVYLKEVVVERKAKDEPPPSFGPGPRDGIVRMEFRPRKKAENPLNVGQGQEYVLAEQGTGFLQRFIESKHVWFAVRSERSELCRMGRETFIPLLERFRDALAPREEREMKRLQEGVAQAEEALRQIEAKDGSSPTE